MTLPLTAEMLLASSTIDIHEACKPNASHIAALTRQLKKLLPNNYKSMMGSAFAGGVMVYYVSEDDARHAVSLLRENGYVAEQLGFSKNLNVWTIAALPLGFKD